MAPVCAVVVAGGSGQRFGNPGGKQLVNVAGRPLMSWSIRAFDRSNKVGHIVVVCPAERRAEMRRLAIDPFDYDTPISFADAGDTRQDSTRAGVHAVPAGFEYVAIHDGARPLITTEAIDHAVDVLVSDRALDGIVCGQPAIDTLKIVDGDNIVETPPRELYWAAQTPQIFSVDAMKRARPNCSCWMTSTRTTSIRGRCVRLSMIPMAITIGPSKASWTSTPPKTPAK